jgi:hypothetical protein
MHQGRGRHNPHRQDRSWSCCGYVLSFNEAKEAIVGHGLDGPAPARGE